MEQWLFTREVKLTKTNCGSKFWPNGAKVSPKLYFLAFPQIYLIRFIYIAKNDSLEQCLIASRGKTHEKELRVKILVKRGKFGAKIRSFLCIFSSSLL